METTLNPTIDPDPVPPLRFSPVTLDTIPLLQSYLLRANSLSCDYSVGGIYMWAEYFSYQYCIAHDTLFLRGVAEDNRHEMAFSLPMGALPLEQCVALLRRYCGQQGVPLVFSAISEERIADFDALHPKAVTELTQWGDYIYRIGALATFKGKRLKQKRNHVNRFAALYPQAQSVPITADLLPAVRRCFERVCATPADSGMAAYERRQVWQVLNHLEQYPFESLCIVVDGEVAGFTLGEVQGRVMLDHIEKSLHGEYEGVNEVLCRNFAAHVMAKYPTVEFINREDDAGDDGLRQSKLSYCPELILKKYDVIF